MRSAQPSVEGLVFDVQRFSVYDGPGIRTTVFLKGCPLRCLWCHNPESQHAYPELGYAADRCLDCGDCVAACPHGAHALVAGRHILDRARCRRKGRCAGACPSGALEWLGARRGVGDLMALVERDRPFYDESGGGVTVSGGEPLRQARFAAAVLARCQAVGLHTTLDTCGYAPWPALAGVAAHADLVLFDLKQMDSVLHRRLTGVSNERILDNCRRLLALPEGRRPQVVVRVPVIPGGNDQPAHYHALGAFLAAAPVPPPVDLLPYHQLGMAKYRKLGWAYPLPETLPPTETQLAPARRVLEEYGLTVRLRVA